MPIYTGAGRCAETARSVSPTMEVLFVPAHDRNCQTCFLHHLLASVQAALCRRAAVRTALWATAGVLGTATVLLMADAIWRFPGSARLLAYLAAPLAGLAGAGVAVLAAWKRAPSALYVARLIERRRPELKNALITFLELASDPRADRSACRAVERRTARILAKADPAALVPPHRLRRPLGAAGLTACLLMVLLWLSQGILIRPWVPQAQAGPASVGQASDLKTHVGPSGTRIQPPWTSENSKEGAEPVPKGIHLTRTGVPPAEANAEKSDTADINGAEAPLASGGSAEGSAAQALIEAVRAERSAFDRLAGALAEQGGCPSQGPSFQNESTPNAAGTATHENGGGNTSSEPAGPDPTLNSGTGTEDTHATSNGGTSAAHPTTNERADRPAGASSGLDGPSEPDATAAANTAETSTGQEPVAGGSAKESEGCPSVGTSPGTGTPGNAGGGSDADKPPIPERPQAPESPKRSLDETQWASQLIREADKRLREGEVTDAFLDRMGMSPAEFRRFVVAWQRKLETAAAGPDKTLAPQEVRTAPGAGGEEIVPGQGSALARAIRDGEHTAPDHLSDLVRVEQSRVSPRLERVVSTYFETVGRLAAEAGRTDEAEE